MDSRLASCGGSRSSRAWNPSSVALGNGVVLTRRGMVRSQESVGGDRARRCARGEKVMQSRILRREFLSGMGAATVALSLPLKTLHARELLYPPADLRYFETPITPAPSEIHFRDASI